MLCLLCGLYHAEIKAIRPKRGMFAMMRELFDESIDGGGREGGWQTGKKDAFEMILCDGAQAVQVGKVPVIGWKGPAVMIGSVVS